MPVSRFEYPGPWAMDPASCRFLAAFVRALGAKRILEFGSGFSTLMMAREIAGEEGNSLVSIDNSALYSSKAKDMLESADCPAKVEFRVAPLRPRLYGTRLLLSYALPKGLIGALGPFDLVLIDTPHHDYVRESVLYDAFDALEPGGYIVLDDANREDVEKRYVRAWAAAYGDAIDPILLEGIGNGLCVIEKLEDAKPAYKRSGSVSTAIKTLRSYAASLYPSKE